MLQRSIESAALTSRASQAESWFYREASRDLADAMDVGAARCLPDWILTSHHTTECLKFDFLQDHADLTIARCKGAGPFGLAIRLLQFAGVQNV